MANYRTADNVVVPYHPEDVIAASREVEARWPKLTPDSSSVADAFAHGLACLAQLQGVRAAGQRAQSRTGYSVDDMARDAIDFATASRLS